MATLGSGSTANAPESDPLDDGHSRLERKVVDLPLRLRRRDHGLDLYLPTRQLRKPGISPRGFGQHFRPGLDYLVDQLVRLLPRPSGDLGGAPGCAGTFASPPERLFPAFSMGGRCLEEASSRRPRAPPGPLVRRGASLTSSLSRPSGLQGLGEDSRFPGPREYVDDGVVGGRALPSGLQSSTSAPSSAG